VINRLAARAPTLLSFTAGVLILLSTSVAYAVDVQISQLVDSPDPAIRGGEITYALSVSNGANDTANDVVVTLPLPATMLFSSVNNSACAYDGSIPPGVVTCNLGSITGDGLGNPVTNIDITLRSSAATGSTVSVTATASTSSTDTNLANNSLAQTTTINDGADLQASIVDLADPVISGATVDYTLTIQNLGPNDAGVTTVVNTLPANVTYTSASGTGWSCSNAGQDVTCTTASILNGVTAPVINISGLVGAVTGTITNSVTVSSVTGEPVPNNNTTTEDTTITVSADLTITKSVSSPLIGGGNVTFTLAPRNLGFFSASTVVVSDPLPAGFAFTSASGTGWSCLHSGEPTGGTVTCSRASYNVAASDDIIIQAMLPASGSFVNTATISAATADPNGSNNSDSANINITPDGADLSLAKSKAPSLIVQGGTMTSTLQVTNSGPLATSGVLTVSDTLAGGETYVGFSGTNWSCTHNGVNPGGIVTCTYASTPLTSGATTSNLIITTLATSLGVLSNSATVADVGGEVDGNPANNSSSASSTSTVPVDLSITKTASTANLDTTLSDDENTISYTLTVTNNSADAANNITVTDLVAGYIAGPPTTAVALSTTPAGFSCTTGATVTCNSGGNFLAGSASAIFVIEVSRPITNNTALINSATVSSSSFADPNSSNNSATATVNVSAQPADLSITKTATTPNANSTLEIDENTIIYTITVDNNGPGPVTGVIMSDTIPGYVTGATNVNVTTTPAGFSCSTGATVTCNNGNNSLANGSSATFVIEVTRPLFDGSLINTATVTSADISDPTPSNNSDTANITVDPVFDVEMQSKIVTPSTVQAGVNATYVLTVRNNGPSSATNVAITDVFSPPAGRSFSKISTTPSQGSCSGWTGDTLNCTIGTLTNGQSETVTVVVRPDWDASDTQWVLPNTATVTYNTSGTTTDSNNSNESQSATLTVDPAGIDILVNKTELIDPIAFDPLVPSNSDQLIYRIDISNGGPSLATGLTLSDTITPKSGKQLTFLCDDAGSTTCAAGTSLCNNTNTSITGPASLVMNCPLPDLAAGANLTRYLFFRIDSAPDASGDTHFNLATVSANETDSVAGNNSEGENTSVRARVDLAVSQSADTNPVQLRQPFNWVIVVTNNGPGSAEQSQLSNTLPAGVELTAAPTPTQGSCTGSAGDTSYSCDLGTINNAANATITVPVRVISYPGSGTITNTATASTFGVDSNPGNDSGSAVVTVQRSSLTGSVYEDTNDNGDRDGGESGIGAIQLQLSGTDLYGNAVSLTTSSATDGSYTFNDLSPSDGSGYTLTQPTQPTGYFDGQENSGGTVVPGSKATDSISAIAVPGNSALNGYLFGELTGTSISGFVWHDANNDGVNDVGETSGVAGVVITLTGTDDLGAPVNTTATTAADGAYTFNGLRPGTYTLNEGSVNGYLPGLAQVGSGANVAGTADNVPTSPAFGNQISGITLQSGDSASGYNFGELIAASLSGTVFNDNNVNGNQEGGEPGVAGVTLTLSGIDDLGQAINLPVTSAADGSYSFTGLRPSDSSGYTITEAQPAGYVDSVDTLGSLGGVLGNDIISAITVASNDTGSGYNFAELSSGIAGFVYVDSNNNGIFDSGEAPISGVTLNVNGEGVNTTATTDATGYYIITGLAAGTYSVSEIQPVAWADGIASAGSAGGIASTNLINAITLGATTIGTGYSFAEQGGSLSGFVYNDINANGVNDPIEPGIPAVTVNLSGTDIDGNPVNITTTSGVDGSYRFSDLPLPDGSGYSISETQPTGISDGIDTLGNLGGTLANDLFSAILFPAAGANGSGYNFGETASGVADLSGSVWLDRNYDRINNDGGGEVDWTVEIIQRANPLDNTNYTLIATTKTDASGNYQFTGLLPGSGYEIRFRHPITGLVYGSPLSSEAGVDLSYGTIRNLTLLAGNNIQNQSLPLDPAGIIYDSLDRTPIEGAVVSVTGPAGFDPAIHLVGGVANVNQTTAADGFYQFLFLAAAPAGTYTLSVVEPAGYLPGGSALIPECNNTLTVSALPDPALVHSVPTPPETAAPIHSPATCPATSSGLAASAASTQYYLSFNLTPGVSGDVVNNHIPLDLITDGAFSVVKTTSKVNVSIGDLVPYVITVTNNLSATFTSIIDIEDQIPPGFKYISGSARLDGEALEPQVDGRTLLWSSLTFSPNQIRELKLVLMVGAGVSEGEYINQAWSENNVIGQIISNIGSANVRVVPDPVFDCTDIIGKIYDDANLNGYPDEGEEPLPAVRVVTARGWLVTSDEFGRYHITCAAVPNALRGSNFILKVDERSLPSGYRITTENPRVIRLTRGKVAQANFGAAIHRVVRLDVANDAFVVGEAELAEGFIEHVDELLPLLKQKVSVLRINYLADFETETLAEQRLALVRRLVSERWEALDCCYNLIIEEELYWRTGKPRTPPSPDSIQQGSTEARP